MILIGFDGYIEPRRVVAVLPAGSDTVASLVEEARHDGRLFDMTADHTCKAVVILDSRQVILSPRSPRTVADRVGAALARLKMRFD
jgi:regulator of extracellular matrix RemA (YlzA/DUF370 family)